jgi:hypothetical protein
MKQQCKLRGYFFSPSSFAGIVHRGTAFLKHDVVHVRAPGRQGAV